MKGKPDFHEDITKQEFKSFKVSESLICPCCSENMQPVIRQGGVFWKCPNEDCFHNNFEPNE
jgi:hypothetical protein